MRNRTACLMLENMLLYNREEIFSRSIRHCDLKGVHSFDLSFSDFFNLIQIGAQ